MAMAQLAVIPSPFRQIYVVRKPRSTLIHCSDPFESVQAYLTRCWFDAIVPFKLQLSNTFTYDLSQVSSRFSSSPKIGTVGSQRMKEDALPGTYWSNNVELGDEITILFNKGSETVTAVARVGENLLKVAERSEVMMPTSDFCFEGSCCHCEMEVVGGASEVGPHGSQKVDELVRSCICPVPSKKGDIQVNLVNEEDVWGERVL